MEFRRDATSGSTTRLTLRDPAAFKPEPKKEEKGGSGSGGGDAKMEKEVDLQTRLGSRRRGTAKGHQMSDRQTIRLLERLSRRMRNIVARGVISLVRDAHKWQSTQLELLDGEVLDDAERAQQYGFSSVPHAGAEAVVLFVGADRSHPVVLAVDDRRYRVQALKDGEVVIYTDEGDRIHLKRERTIEVTTRHFVVKAEDDVRIETKNFSVQADQSVQVETASTRFATGALAFGGPGRRRRHGTAHRRHRGLAGSAKQWRRRLPEPACAYGRTGRERYDGQPRGRIAWISVCISTRRTACSTLCSPGRWPDLQGDDGLMTAVIISLFTDARAHDDDPLPDERVGVSSDRRGWWGDCLPDAQGEQTLESIGSRLWLLWREKDLDSVVAVPGSMRKRRWPG